MKNFRVSKIKPIIDSRGKLVVFLQGKELGKKNTKFGQVYLATFNKKGGIRGNHYHKKWFEWFGVTEGKVKIIIEHVKTGERKVLTLDAKKDKYIRIETGPFVAHAIQSLTKHATVMSYANIEWNDKDTYPYKLL